MCLNLFISYKFFIALFSSSSLLSAFHSYSLITYWVELYREIKGDYPSSHKKVHSYITPHWLWGSPHINFWDHPTLTSRTTPHQFHMTPYQFWAWSDIDFEDNPIMTSRTTTHRYQNHPKKKKRNKTHVWRKKSRNMQVKNHSLKIRTWVLQLSKKEKEI